MSHCVCKICLADTLSAHSEDPKSVRRPSADVIAILTRAFRLFYRSENVSTVNGGRRVRRRCGRGRDSREKLIAIDL